MSKKNKLSTRVKAHAFDLKREQEDQVRRAQRKAGSEQMMKVDKKISKGKKLPSGKKKKVAVKISVISGSAVTKLKTAQAMMGMEIDC